MIRSLTDKNVIVTGGSSGLGKAIVEAFAKEGCNVLFTYNTPAKASAVNRYAAELTARYGRKATGVMMNVGHSAEHLKMLRAANTFFGREPDILVNNAGILDIESFPDIPERSVRKVMDTNFIGPFLLTQKVASLWKNLQRHRQLSGKPLKESYQVINIGSISGTLATGLSIYEATKAAMKMFTKSIAYELSAFNIYVNNIAPGLVPTGMNDGLHETELWKDLVKAIPMGRTGTPEAIAAMTVAVAKNTFMTGSTIRVDGGRCVNPIGSRIHAENAAKRAA